MVMAFMSIGREKFSENFSAVVFMVEKN